MFAHVDTPALILDAAKVERNCARMRERVHGAGVAETWERFGGW